MPEGHVILLANFYGSYLNKQKFKAVAIVNNAGIEQLATLGVEKVKEVKASCNAKDEVWVVMVAGLTDVLIKSVEQGKNKLEITPNSTQLLETKMQWAHSILCNEGAKVIWVVMPPISLRMYHISEGWNINKIPGMSGGLDKEQRALNNLMYNYRNLCTKLNLKDAKSLIKGLFFTDMVSELSHDRGSMNLNTGYFESDGISPASKLVDNWTSQINKVFVALDKKFMPRTPPRRRSPPIKPLVNLGNGDSWDLPPPKDIGSDRSDRGMKRPFSDEPSLASSLGSRRDAAYEFERDRKLVRDSDYDKFARSGDDYSPAAKIPSLVDMAKSLESPRQQQEFPSLASLGDKPSKEMATAVQLLAATMQLGGSNPSNMQSVFNALLAQQQKEKEDRRLEEERIILKRKIEEERLKAKQEEARQLETLRQIEETKRQEAKYREEMRRREEDRRREERLLEERRQIEIARKREEERARELVAQRRAAEEQRLREVQIAAKLAMEQQQREQMERQRKAQLLQEQQAQIALMAVTKQVRDQMAQKHTDDGQAFNAANRTPTSALDRINEKLKTDREKKEPIAKFDRNIAKDQAWGSPVVLFSFLNRSHERKPLRGIYGQKLGKHTNKAGDIRSRGQWIYNEAGAQPPSAVLLKLQVRRPGAISEFETKVSHYNNRLYDMIDECESLLQEGRSLNYIIRRETDEPNRSNKSRESTSADPKNIKPAEKPTTAAAKPAASASKSASNEEKKAKTTPGGVGVKDLRECISKPTQNRSRSKTPGDSNKPSASISRRSTEAKPRWDKSDESEDELLWDDDPVPIKPLIDDDDVRPVKATAEEAMTEKQLPRGVGSAANANVAARNHAPSVVRTTKEAGVALTEKSSTIRGNIKTDEHAATDDFITLDDTAEDAEKVDNDVIEVASNSDNFLTIDEAA